LQGTVEKEPTGYAPADLDAWAKRLRAWAGGKEPGDLPRVGDAAPGAKKRPVFAYMISGAKVRAPAAAMALIERLRR
jgi:uncharacterized protein YecE (DUF72 family)